MRNERDNKFEGDEDSEYHFSEEESGYDVETEAPKAEKPASKFKLSSLSGGMTRSKRMIISGIIFIGLVVVVYKMVMPTSSSSIPTDITPAVVAEKNGSNPIANQAVSPQAPVVSQPIAQAQPVIPVAAPTPPATMPEQPTPQPIASSAPVQPQTQFPAQLPAQSQPTMAQSNPMSPTNPMPATSQPVVTMAAPPVSQVPFPQPSATPIPVPTSPVMTSPTAPPTAPLPAVPNNNVVDSGIAAMTATENKLTSQIQGDYVQKLNEYEAQNKALRDQMDILNTRVTTMETQINQLVQALTHQNQNVSSAAPPSIPSAVPPVPSFAQAAPPKIAYNVQAIIPGRAWLRGDNGETLTVAEGDVIKEVGRVTKIDPYDGVVEINTGTKLVSLSYGNGA